MYNTPFCLHDRKPGLTGRHDRFGTRTKSRRALDQCTGGKFAIRTALHFCSLLQHWSRIRPPLRRPRTVPCTSSNLTLVLRQSHYMSDVVSSRNLHRKSQQKRKRCLRMTCSTLTRFRASGVAKPQHRARCWSCTRSCATNC